MVGVIQVSVASLEVPAAQEPLASLEQLVGACHFSQHFPGCKAL